MNGFGKLAAVSVLLSILPGCTTHPPMETVDHVDLDRFMGDWYVIANIPTFLEKGAHNAVERYRLNSDGTVATNFTFLDGGFDGARREYNPTGFIVDTRSNAVWGMRFIWPIKADYRIVHLETDYGQTIIGRQARDYVWIMARTPEIPENLYQSLLRIVERLGYDSGKVRRVPQQWPESKESRP